MMPSSSVMAATLWLMSSSAISLVISGHHHGSGKVKQPHFLFQVTQRGVNCMATGIFMVWPTKQIIRYYRLMLMCSTLVALLSTEQI